MIDQKCEGLTSIDTENSFQFDQLRSLNNRILFSLISHQNQLVCIQLFWFEMCLKHVLSGALCLCLRSVAMIVCKDLRCLVLYHTLIFLYCFLMLWFRLRGWPLYFHISRLAMLLCWLIRISVFVRVGCSVTVSYTHLTLPTKA